MNVVATGPGDATSGEIPNGYPSIIATHSQLSASLVEGAGQSFAATVQHTLVVLRGKEYNDSNSKLSKVTDQTSG